MCGRLHNLRVCFAIAPTSPATPQFIEMIRVTILSQWGWPVKVGYNYPAWVVMAGMNLAHAIIYPRQSWLVFLLPYNRITGNP
jgi:hypothetical protein